MAVSARQAVQAGHARQLIYSLRHVSLPQKHGSFSVTMVVLALETSFWSIDTEKVAYFCGTMIVFAVETKFLCIVTEKYPCFCGTIGICASATP